MPLLRRYQLPQLQTAAAIQPRNELVEAATIDRKTETRYIGHL